MALGKVGEGLSAREAQGAKLVGCADDPHPVDNQSQGAARRARVQVCLGILAERTGRHFLAGA
ncbi:hypothetical protein [Streptomyces flaveolus]|uniref:hypothetical protein n=1 Tax=Streptomyces flaveolus TaxID=67297 RepID=UPI003700DC04